VATISISSSTTTSSDKPQYRSLWQLHWL